VAKLWHAGFSYLVGGFNHLEKYEFVNGKDYHGLSMIIPYIMENKTCLKPPTRYISIGDE